MQSPARPGTSSHLRRTRGRALDHTIRDHHAAQPADGLALASLQPLPAPSPGASRITASPQLPPLPFGYDKTVLRHAQLIAFSEDLRTKRWLELHFEADPNAVIDADWAYPQYRRRFAIQVQRNLRLQPVLEAFPWLNAVFGTFEGASRWTGEYGREYLRGIRPRVGVVEPPGFWYDSTRRVTGFHAV